MKIVNDIRNFFTKDKIEVVKQKQEERQLKLVGKLHPQRGQSVYELNLDGGTIEIAQVNKSLDLAGNVHKQSLVIKAMHLYCVAINKKNAERKFIEMMKNITG